MIELFTNTFSHLTYSLAETLPGQHTLSPVGWIIMILALGGMTCLLGWCIYKVVTVSHPEEHLHTQADITPPDELEERN